MAKPLGKRGLLEWVARKATQSVQETPRNGLQVKTPAQRKTPVLQGLACSCESLQLQGIAGTGFDSMAKTPGKTAKGCVGGSESVSLVLEDRYSVILHDNRSDTPPINEEQIMAMMERLTMKQKRELLRMLLSEVAESKVAE